MSQFLKCFNLKKVRNGTNVSNSTCSKCGGAGGNENSATNGDSTAMSDDSTDGQGVSRVLESTSEIISSCTTGSSADTNNGNRSPTATVGPDGIPYFMEKDEAVRGKTYMPVSKYNPNYKMDHKRRGKALVFNFDRWENTTLQELKLKPRQGSEKDKRDLVKCLKKLDFEVNDKIDNLKNLEFYAVLEEVRKEDHEDADCLVVVVMTHGEKNTIFLADGTQVPINLIWEKFEADKCPTLAGKPKIFIVQACRGTQYDSGTTLYNKVSHSEQRQMNVSDVTDSGNFSYVIPNAADILVAFSCPIGHYSWRHPERGSWFIQSICKVFNKYAYQMDIQQLFTTVAREVALNYESSTDNIESDKKKQVTSTSSTLIRTLKFERKVKVVDRISNDELKSLVAQKGLGPPTSTVTNGHHNGSFLQDPSAVAVESVTVAAVAGTNVNGVVAAAVPPSPASQATVEESSLMQM